MQVQVLAAVSDFTVRVWDAGTGAALMSLRGHTKSVHVLEGHPLEPDVAFCASYDGHVSIWDLDQACLLNRSGLDAVNGGCPRRKPARTRLPGIGLDAGLLCADRLC